MMMKCSKIGLVLLLAAMPVVGLAASNSWVLDHSTVTYTVHHPFKTASGTSKDAKGKGQCINDQCGFLIGVPVKSFDSGDSNRDLHMLEVTRGGANPMIVVRTKFDQRSLVSKPLLLTFDIEFAGGKATYKEVPFDLIDKSGDVAHIKGTIMIKLSDFAIEPPSLLTIPIKNDVPIDVDSFWKKSN